MKNTLTLTQEKLLLRLEEAAVIDGRIYSGDLSLEELQIMMYWQLESFIDSVALDNGMIYVQLSDGAWNLAHVIRRLRGDAARTTFLYGNNLILKDELDKR